MKIAIIVAMQKELDLLLPLMGDCTEHQVNGVTIYSGQACGHEVAVIKCGIGKVNAAFGAMNLIVDFHPDLVINTGVAGGTGSDARVLDVVVGRQVAYHDVWCGPGTVRGEVQGLPRYFEGAHKVTEMDCLYEMPDVKIGLIASGDCFVDSPEILATIRESYPGVKAVDMESAPIAHVCHLMGVPFVSIRVVSDTPGQIEDNASQYANFWDDAPRHAFSILTTILDNL